LTRPHPFPMSRAVSPPHSYPLRFILTDRPAVQFALPSRRNYNSSKCPTLHGSHRNSVITSILEREEEGAEERARELLEIDDFATNPPPNELVLFSSPAIHLVRTREIYSTCYAPDPCEIFPCVVKCRSGTAQLSSQTHDADSTDSKWMGEFGERIRTRDRNRAREQMREKAHFSE